ncbi:hypothetical protein DRN75_02485 [Nanoarchaeota archaeon]|nr:MAG: hypothetical protein DRN75_02485 [Nanoarchaeota archaeon]
MISKKALRELKLSYKELSNVSKAMKKVTKEIRSGDATAFKFSLSEAVYRVTEVMIHLLKSDYYVNEELKRYKLTNEEARRIMLANEEVKKKLAAMIKVLKKMY